MAAGGRLLALLLCLAPPLAAAFALGPGSSNSLRSVMSATGPGEQTQKGCMSTLSSEAADAHRLTAGHNLRNQDPILQMLRKHLPERAAAAPAGAEQELHVLEIGAGTGQHAAYMPSRLHGLVWHPTDYDSAYAQSVTAWTRDMPNVRPWQQLDASLPAQQWGVPLGSFECVYNCNTIHIAPPEVMDGLVKGAAACLKAGGVLITYGPYKLGGQHTAESNAAFDESLRGRDPRWGIRDYEHVCSLAAAAGFETVAREDMPSNNMLCVWRKL